MSAWNGNPMEPRVACCAFAAYLLMQLLAPFVWLRDRLFGPRVAPAGAAAAWAPGQAVEAVRASAGLAWRRGLVLAVAIEIAVLAVGYQAVRATPGPASAAMSWSEALHASWCGTGPRVNGSLPGG